ncbi:cytochrome b5-like heme/steroid binding domain-containing protein [Aquiluna sp.]|nr:cytochrome b5-like heme/steroid binding domain-containing protein [Aquiluna sp.]
MRIALLLASLLVLTGCGSSEPAAQTPVQTTEQVEANSATDEESQELSDEPAEEEPQEQESDESGEQDGESPEPEESEPSEEDSRDDEQTEDEASEDEAESDEPAGENSEEPQPTQTAEPTQDPQESVNGFTLAQVSERNSAAECWVAIDGGVYDLTQWIRSHPGGSGAILNLCGKDGSASFTSQHGGQARPSSTLDGYYLAPLVG